MAASQDGFGKAEGKNLDETQNAKQATKTSKVTMDPQQTSHNMNDFKIFDFNSADEVRQTMKAILSGKTPQQNLEEKSSYNIVSQSHTKIKTEEKCIECDKKPEKAIHAVHIQTKDELFQCVNPKTDEQMFREGNNVAKKRPGRPPKAGSSKKVKRNSLSAMYLGKLSNVVPFKRKFGRYSTSDSEDS